MVLMCVDRVEFGTGVPKPEVLEAHGNLAKLA